jgi:sugar lactone lactonase YvrE
MLSWQQRVRRSVHSAAHSRAALDLMGLDTHCPGRGAGSEEGGIDMIKRLAMRLSRRFRLLVGVSTIVAVVLVGVLATVTRSHRALAYTTSNGFAASDFVTGLPNNSVLGPIGLAFDPSGNLFVMDQFNAQLYKFGPTGGVPSAATQVSANAIPGNPTGIAFDKAGHLYVALRDAGEVAELDPSNGTVIRTVATGICDAEGIVVDPLSGDLFVTSWLCHPDIYRVSGFASGPGTVSSYATPGTTDGLTVAPDGTLYVAVGGNSVARIAVPGPGSPPATPGAVTPIVSIDQVDGLGVSRSQGSPFLLANRNNGTITKIDLSTSPPTLTDVFTGGTRGDFATVGPDGCLYATQTSSIVKVTNADGSCSLAPTAPDTSAPHTTATLSGKASPAGWYTGPVTVTLAASDPDGAATVAGTYYTLDGGTAQDYSAPFTIAGDGSHPLSFWSVDKAGNVEDKTAQSNTVTVQIDATPPGINGSRSPAANSDGWNNTDVTVSFDCTDPAPSSGMASCTGPTTVSTEGAGQSVTGTATDKAGNSATATVSGINIDKTPPTVTFAGNAGTYTVDQTVNITCSAADSLSGIASTTCKDANGPAYSFSAGANTLTASATDKAGNTGTGSAVFTVQVTFDGLCALTKQFDTGENDGHSLCVKLLVASLLREFGFRSASNRVLGAYIHEVNAQSGKTLTDAQAATLVQLASALMA